MPSVVRITAPGMPSVVRVPAPASPSVVRREVAGIPGPSPYDLWLQDGHVGTVGDFLASLRSTVPGPPGTQTGFGQLRVADTKVDPEDAFAAGVRQQLIFTPDPAQTRNRLRDPFTPVSWTNNRFVVRPNGIGDWQYIEVNLLVVPQFAGGGIIADLDAGTAAPVQTAYYGLRGSGVAERATFRLGTETLAGVSANGIRIFLTGTVPFVVQSEAVIYVPISTGPTP